MQTVIHSLNYLWQRYLFDKIVFENKIHKSVVVKLLNIKNNILYYEVKRREQFIKDCRSISFCSIIVPSMHMSELKYADENQTKVIITTKNGLFDSKYIKHYNENKKHLKCVIFV